MQLVKQKNNTVSLNSESYQLERISEKVFNAPLIKKIKLDVLLDLIMQFIAKVHNDCGQTAKEEDLIIQSNELLNSLTKNYSWITISEVPEIFSQGRRKAFGDWFGLNLNTYEVWIDKYYSEKRADEIKKRRLSLQEENKISKPTPEQNEKAFNNLLTELFVEYNSTNKISSVFLYNILFKKGLLPEHTEKYKEGIKKRAIKKLYKKKGERSDTLISNKRIAVLKMAFKNGLEEKEAIELLKKYEVKNLKSETSGIKKQLNLIQNGKQKGLIHTCKEIILIDYINTKIKR